MKFLGFLQKSNSNYFQKNDFFVNFKIKNRARNIKPDPHSEEMKNLLK